MREPRREPSGDKLAPRAVVSRISLYLRQLEAAAAQGRSTLSSRQLGGALGISDAQVRKDLAFFGQFGHPGIGYGVEELSTALRRILADVHARQGVIAAVCHGPAALIDVPTATGGDLLAGRRVTGFSNAEERFLMAEPVQQLGFLLQDALAARADFIEGPMYLEHVVVDGRLLTGQNPWSSRPTWKYGLPLRRMRVIPLSSLPRETFRIPK